MDPHSLHVLEYRRVIEKLMGHASCSLGREFASQLEPLPYPETVVRRLQETREAREMRDKDSGMPLGGIRDIRETLERARIAMMLVPQELLDVMHTTAAGRRLRLFLLNRKEKYPVLAEMATNIPILQLIETKIDGSISEGGTVRDSASAELGRIRSGIKIAQNRLNDRLQGILASEKYRTFIQEFVVTVREGRYCIPVKHEYAKAFGGLVHDASASGATVFIEPTQAVDLGNELKQLAIKEEQEIFRILSDLSGLVGSYYSEMQSMVSILGHLDVIHAKAILAEEMDAIEPKLNRKGIVKLYNARHPFLPGKVTPIDVELGERFTTLLITGPNTGGKTVTLKTVGLLTLMTLSGMQIPAGPDSEIALFDQIFADIGDEQDIQQSLSTFSAHLKNIVRIVETMRPNALILMDEVGAGTDPAEGAALAKSLFDHFQFRNARVIATTHYGELKEYAYARANVENASVEFDKETLTPTYRILLGVPGSSNALYIASRLGLRAEIVDEARGFLSNREIETGQLLQRIEESRKKTGIAEREAIHAKEEAIRLQEEYQLRVQQIADAQRTARQQAQEEAKEIIRRASDKAENLLKELQKMNKGVKKGPNVRQRFNTLRNDTYQELAQKGELPAEELAPIDPGHVYKAGEKVRVLSLNLDGELLENPKNGLVPLQVGMMRVTLPLEQLRPLKRSEAAEAEKRARAKQAALSTGVGEIAMQKAAMISPELMLRGMRVEEAHPLLDKYMDDASAGGINQVRIIHGKGTGALRSAVWSFLSGHPGVSSYRAGDNGEGGDGATVVTMK